MISYNVERPHAALNDLTLSYLNTLISNCPLDGEA